MIKINNNEEKIKYFDDVIKGDGAYFNVKYEGEKVEFIWVSKFENWMNDDINWYLEYPNQLMRYENLTEDSLKPFYDKEENEWITPFDWCYIDGGTAYEIISFQCTPFLPEVFEIEFVTDIEDEAVKYMINNGL